MVHSTASSQTAEDDMLQLSVIRTEAGDAGGKKGMEGNNKMEDAVRKSLLTLSNVDQVIFKNRHLRQEFLKYDAAAAKLKVTVFV